MQDPKSERDEVSDAPNAGPKVKPTRRRALRFCLSWVPETWANSSETGPELIGHRNHKFGLEVEHENGSQDQTREQKAHQLLPA